MELLLILIWISVGLIGHQNFIFTLDKPKTSLDEILMIILLVLSMIIGPIYILAISLDRSIHK